MSDHRHQDVGDDSRRIDEARADAAPDVTLETTPDVGYVATCYLDAAVTDARNLDDPTERATYLMAIIDTSENLFSDRQRTLLLDEVFTTMEDSFQATLLGDSQELLTQRRQIHAQLIRHYSDAGLPDRAIETIERLGAGSAPQLSIKNREGTQITLDVDRPEQSLEELAPEEAAELRDFAENGKIAARAESFLSVFTRTGSNRALQRVHLEARELADDSPYGSQMKSLVLAKLAEAHRMRGETEAAFSVAAESDLGHQIIESIGMEAAANGELGIVDRAAGLLPANQRIIFRARVAVISQRHQ